jgi:NADH:ubiquinone oxidoreductase subunit 5 (subunit L)/multisubunit Na+/H+ antiporter MnhA subunit
LVPDLPQLHVGLLLGGLGVFAILLGNLMALMQARLKLLVAYSTLAQIGYLFLLFPLASGASGGPAATAALIQVVSHALAKASLFLLAGRILVAFGHDRLPALDGFGRAMPATLLVILMAGLALVGLPPSGGYLVKSLYASAAADLGAWWWPPALELGGLLSAAYLARILSIALSPAPASGTGTGAAAGGGHILRAPITGLAAPALLAVCALLLGLLPPALFSVMDVARPGMGSATAVAGVMLSALTPSGFWRSAGPVLTVALVVVLFHSAGESAWGRRIASIGRGVAGFEGWLRQWRTAGALLLLFLLIQVWTSIG